MNEALPNLLRAIASGSHAQENKHDVILNLAADEIEQLRKSKRILDETIKALERSGGKPHE